MVNTNLPEQWIRKLLYKKELSDLADYRSDIFKKINIGQYILKDQTQHSGMVNTMLWMIYGMHNYALEKEQIRPANITYINGMIYWLRETMRSVCTQKY